MTVTENAKTASQSDAANAIRNVGMTVAPNNNGLTTKEQLCARIATTAAVTKNKY